MAYNFSKVSVLVVEATKEMYRLFRDVLSMLEVPDRNIFPAYSMEEAFENFCKNNYDIVITDWLANPDQGIALTKQIRTHARSPNRFVPIIMTAGSGHLSRVMRARDSGISEYLVKPFTAEGLAMRITRVIEQPRHFVISETYVGPERRVKAAPYEGEDRRKEKPKQAAEK